MSEWRAGAASTSIPVDDGTPLAGYAARTGSARGTLDELTASCLMLEAGGNRLAIVAIDLIGVDESMVDEIARRTGVPAFAIVLAASHTHSGPSRVIERLHPARQESIDDVLRERFIAACTDVVVGAGQRVQPATVALGSTEVRGIAANRLDPNGPFDPTVSIVAVKRVDGSPIATLVHFACHPTILPAESLSVSADFPGALRSSLPLPEFGTVLFANGAAGDISTRFTRRSQDVAEVKRVGQTIAEAVRCCRDWTELDPSIEARSLRVDLPFRTTDEVRSVIESMSSDLATSPVSRVEITRKQGLAILKEALTATVYERASVTVGFWSLGELKLVGFPGELFSSLGSRLIAAKPGCLILGYTNGYAGYFPDEAAYRTGSYEALASPYSSATVEALMAAIGMEL